MKIAIAGISGFTGNRLNHLLKEKGIATVAIKRKDFMRSDKDMADYLTGCDAVINLAGSPVIKRWTNENRKEILESRTGTTKKLVKAFGMMDNRPELFINASAIGIYDYTHENNEYTSFYGDNFLTRVVKSWEQEAFEAKALKMRVCVARFGVVLGNEGGAFPQLLKPFRFGLGGKLASGRQAMSFIHIADLTEALYFMVNHANSSGVYNLVAPNYCTNAEFTKTLATILRKPAFLRVPEFVLKLLYGKAAEVIIGGEMVVPYRLQEEGFSFKYPTIYEAVSELIKE